jgi:Cu+-exporting ATPase
MLKKNIKVNGMTCAMCAKTITNTFEHYDGISAKVNVGAGKVLFSYDEEKYSLNDIAKIVKDIGYEAVLEDTLQDNKRYNKKLKRDIYISVIMSFPLLWAMFSHIEFFDFLYVPSLFNNGYFQLFVASVVQFYIGRKFYKAAYKSIKKNVFGMDILVVLGTTSAYLYSLYLLIMFELNGGHHPVYYFEISSIIITMILIGNYIEHYAKERTTDSLVELVNLGAKEARVLRDNEEIMIDINEVMIGDEIIVLKNEKIPVDGEIIKGSSYIDESMITGESIPVKKDEKSQVVGATINIGNKINIKATKVGSDTMLAKIIETVEEASLKKPPIQRSADKVASYFVPIVITIAVLNFLVQYFLLNVTFVDSFERTIAILVISCPCALGLATPTSILVGNGKAAQNHILYKGGEFFEIANKIDAIAFDKTGTLTLGKPVVTDFLGNDDVLKYVYALEKESTHPISKASVEYARMYENSLDVNHFQVYEGLGISGTVDGKEVYIGSFKILQKLSISNNYEKQANQLLTQAKTVNYVVVNKTLEALYAVRDEIKETSKSVIEEMIKRGITPYMITGDHKLVADQIAKELGITHVYSEVLPQEKAEIIKDIQKDYRVVGFVGDGINDAPALKLADVGFAMGEGTDIAIDSSDVTLMSHDLGLVIKAIDLSNATLRNIYQNFLWAFSYNLVAIPLAATGRLSMVVSGAAMAFSSITVVLNALRLKRYKFIDFKKEKGEQIMEKFIVTDMTCNHCKMTIEKALKENGLNEVEINLDTHEVLVDLNGKTKEEVKEIITSKGYNIQ